MSILYLRFPGGKSKALTLSYDDGVKQDKKLIPIMQQHGLKGTFNLNSGLYADTPSYDTPGAENMIFQRMCREEVDELYTNSGMEVAVHGLEHALYDHMPDNLCLNDLMNDRVNLEKQFNRLVRGMAYPYGCFNDEVVDIAKRVGLVYGRTVISSHNFGIPTDWLRLQPTCHHNDPELMNLAQRFVKEEVRFGSRLFYLWGHSYEFDEQDNWNVIEEFASYMGGREDIWYATNMEIYDYVHAFEQLVFSMDFKRVWNPTTTELCFDLDGKAFCVLPGEEKVL